MTSNAPAQSNPAAGFYDGGSFGEAHLSEACSGINAIVPISGASPNCFSVLGKLGTIWWDAESTTNTGSQSDDDFDLSYGLGLQFTISERFLIRAEWERFNNVGIANAGRSDVDLWTAGLAFKF